MKTIEVERTAEFEEALAALREHLDSFKEHHEKRVHNGAHYILSDEGRLTRYGVQLAAEMLEQQGLTSSELSWLKPKDDEN